MGSAWQPIGVFCSDAPSGVRMGYDKDMDEHLFADILLDIQKESMWLTGMHTVKQNFYDEIKEKGK